MNPRILIVDDNPDIHSDFRKILAPDNRTAELDALEKSIFGTSPAAEGCQCDLEFASQGIDALAMVRRALAEGRP
jgi:CheY-like chemotaxis protein